MNNLLKDLARAKVAFQLRSIEAALGIDPNAKESQCDICGDYHMPHNAPRQRETGDGY